MVVFRFGHGLSLAPAAWRVDSYLPHEQAPRRREARLFGFIRFDDYDENRNKERLHVFANPVRAALVSAAIGARQISNVLAPRTRPVPGISLDDLGTTFRELAAARDEGEIRTGLGNVIAGLDAQAPLVSGPFEVTYLWLIVKMQSLCNKLEENTDTDRVIETVNSLATELADALG